MPNIRCKNVGELAGIFLVEAAVLLFCSAVLASFGFGLICSPKTSKRFCAVPSGVQVISVMYGLSLPICSDATSVGLTTLVPVIL